MTASRASAGAEKAIGHRSLSVPDPALKEDLIKEVTEAVRQHLESRTSDVVDVLWQRGQHVVQQLQQHQLKQTEQLQGQLAACAESYRKLERENAMLRSSLEVVLKHLTQTFGPAPSHVQHPPLFPQMPPKFEQAASCDEDDALTSAESAQCQPSEQLVTTDNEALAPKSASASVVPAPPPKFTITLRRADQVPLGLEVQGENGATCLTVSSVRPGGAIEAWNRQCAGDEREIRAGDRIVGINSADNADSMRAECLTKHLLKITVVRQSSHCDEMDEGNDVAASVAVSAAEAALGECGMRADAHEFVPNIPPAPAVQADLDPPEVASGDVVEDSAIEVALEGAS